MGELFFIFVVLAGSMIVPLIVPWAYMPDLFLIAACFFALHAQRRSGLFIVWILGILRAGWASPVPEHNDMYDFVVNQTELHFSYTHIFFALYFVGMYTLIRMLRDRVQCTHPITRLAIIAIVSLVYHFGEILTGSGEGMLIRLFGSWNSIMFLAFIDTLWSVLFFKLFMSIPARTMEPEPSL